MTNFADYRLVLASRSDIDTGTGLGAPILSDVLPIGVEGGADHVLTWSQTLNAAGSIEFTLPLDGVGVTSANFAPGQRELHLYRNVGAGEVLVWAGHLWVADVKKPWVRFMGAGWYEALRHRQMDKDYFKKDVEQVEVAWGLIDYTQQRSHGNIGITRGTDTGTLGTTRTIVLCAEERSVIADSLEDLASADDGFDFEITPNKVWNTYHSLRGTDKSGTVTLDASSTVQDLAYTIDATQVENEVAGIGEVIDCEPIQYYTASDATSQTAYGLMQGVLTRSELRQDKDEDKPLLEQITKRQLATRKDARSQPVVQLHWALSSPSPLATPAAFGLGDTIALTASRGFASLTAKKFRVLSYEVNVTNLGDETINVTLDSAV